MRVNLMTKTFSGPGSKFETLPISLTIRPACGLPGDFQYLTDSDALLLMLKTQTDLPYSVLRRFEGEMRSASNARLLGVELSDRALTDVGYFVD